MSGHSGVMTCGIPHSEFAKHNFPLRISWLAINAVGYSVCTLHINEVHCSVRQVKYCVIRDYSLQFDLQLSV